MRQEILLIALFLSHIISAQQRCGTLAPVSGEFENWIDTKIQQKKLERPTKTQQAIRYQIPVVVHLFHKGEAIGNGLNLSDSKIRGQIDSLNADFGRTNADTINTPSDFLSVASDTEIEFVLAKQDPNGNPTNGIVRINGQKEVYRVNDDKVLLRSESYWSPENYLNIIVADLKVFIGYSSFPVTSLEGINHNNDDFILDGVYVDYTYFGVNPFAHSFESRGRTLTHEIGHFFGLRHIWGDGNCTRDDFVDDTPTSITDHEGISSPCSYPLPDDESTFYNDGNSCTQDDPDFPDMFQNYMDYTDDICMNLFTQGQADRMRTVLENSPRRASLTNSPALNEPARFSNDLAATKIISPRYGECDDLISPELEVTNFGINEIHSYDLQFFINGNPIGALVSRSTNLQPFDSDYISVPDRLISSVPFTVSFELSNVNGSVDGNTFNNSISRTISSISSLNLPYVEDFESSNTLFGSFADNSPWDVRTAPKETVDNQALVFEAFGNSSSFDENVIIETPPFDLNGVSSAIMSFSYAYAPLTGHFSDGLVVEASTDCGTTYREVLFPLVGSQFQTAPGISSEFVPVNTLEWRDTTLGISSFRDFDGVQFRFKGLNGSGNNFYLDNIAIEEVTVLPNDVSIKQLNSTLVTCNNESRLTMVIRNAGFETITSFSISYEINGNTTEQTFTNLSIEERGYASFGINTGPLNEKDNLINVSITKVNNVSDMSETGNMMETIIHKNTTSDEFPLTVDFETTDNWTTASPTTTSIWERTSLVNNGVLRANVSNEMQLGSESWFISPALGTGGLDSAGLYFRASYTARNGLNDQLRVLLSTNCGETYSTTLLYADSDSLSVVASGTQRGVPTSDIGWKEYRLDISNAIPFKDKIRLAFVFTNGNGNDLYIDDISIRGNEPPMYSDVFRIYPNPANTTFNLGFNLPQKEEVTVEIQDVSGRLIIKEKVTNALNQIITIEIFKGGLYFVRVSGNNFSQTQKLFINR